MGKVKFVKLERDLIRSRQYRLMGSSARDLYTWMLDTMFEGTPFNTSPRRVLFGPSDGVKRGMSRATYYRALDRMINYGVVVEVEVGGHGKRSMYDLTAWKWKNGS